MSYSIHTHSLILLAPIAWILGSIPAYVIGSKLGVAHAWVAFIPGVGPYIVLLQSIKRSGWLCLFALIPLVNLVFFLWLIFAIPTDHGRTRWWTLAFLIPLVNVIAYFAYAFSLDPSRRPGSSGGFGSTYHVPPGARR